MSLIHFVFVFNIFTLQLISTKAGVIKKDIPVKDLLESGEIGSLLERQIPEDVIYDLAGRKMLITRDEVTEEYHTFMVHEDENGLPYVKDPQTGHKYLVKSSRIKKGVDIYRMILNADKTPVVADWATMTVNEIKLNKYGEVELKPIVESEKTYTFGGLDFKVHLLHSKN